MKTNCLAHYTNLAYAECLGSVEEKENYFLIKREDRPDFFWGNYLILKNKLVDISPDQAKRIFENEFGRYQDAGYMAITFDIDMLPEYVSSDFKKAGFDVLKNKVLSTNKVNRTDKVKNEFTIRPIESEWDWQQYFEVHFDKEWSYGNEKQQLEFLKCEVDDFKKIIHMGRGNRFGAFLNNKLVGELGVFWKGSCVRFNNVATHDSYRRMGVCNTLVYTVSSLLFSAGFQTLVMEADENYYAAKIYESLGFQHNETVTSFEKYIS